MSDLTFPYLVVGVVTVITALVGVTYASKTLALLRRNPEIRRVQQKLWLPILTSGALITVGAAFDALSYFISIEFDQEMLELTATYVMVAGLLLLLLGISRYSSLWNQFDLAKRRNSEKSVAK